MLKQRIHFLILSGLSLLLSGCVSSPPPIPYASATLSADHTYITVYRPASMDNFLVNPMLQLNGQNITALKNNSLYRFKLEPGVFLLQLKLPERYQGQHQQTVNADAEQHYYYRISSQLEFRKYQPYGRFFHLQPVETELALRELAGIPSVDSHAATATPGNTTEDDTQATKESQFSISKTRNPFSH